MKTDTKEINNQGVVHFLNNNFDQAKNKYMEVLSLDSGNTTTLNNLGLLYLHEKRYKEAEELFRKAFGRSENETYALNLGHSLMHQGHYEEAEKSYLKSIGLNKANIQAWESLVSLYEYTNQLPKAKDALETMILTVDQRINYKIRLSRILIKTGEYKDALEVLHNSLEQRGFEAEILYYIALIHFRNQNLGLAKTAIQNSLSHNPFRELSLELGATIALSASDIEAAIGYWDQMLKINTMNHAARINKSILIISKKERNRALNELDYVLNFEPGNPKARYYKALLYLEEKNTLPEAEKILSGLLQSENDYAEKAQQILNCLKQNKYDVD